MKENKNKEKLNQQDVLGSQLQTREMGSDLSRNGFQEKGHPGSANHGIHWRIGSEITRTQRKAKLAS